MKCNRCGNVLKHSPVDSKYFCNHNTCYGYLTHVPEHQLDKVTDLKSKLATKDKAIAELEQICIGTYMCFHVSELPTMYKPVQDAWKKGQELNEERKRGSK